MVTTDSLQEVATAVSDGTITAVSDGTIADPLWLTV